MQHVSIIVIQAYKLHISYFYWRILCDMNRQSFLVKLMLPWRGLFLIITDQPSLNHTFLLHMRIGALCHPK